MRLPCLPTVILAMIFAGAMRAEDRTQWLVHAECQMVSLPQKIALPLLADLNDEAKIDAAWAKVQQMIERGEAALIANMDVKGDSEKPLTSESVEETRYPTGFDPPQLPKDVPKDKIAEVLKNWPVVGITPTTFEMRNMGQMLEVTATVAGDGAWLAVDVTMQHVRLLRHDKFDAGTLPSGEHLSIEQPQFSALKNTTASARRWIR